MSLHNNCVDNAHLNPQLWLTSTGLAESSVILRNSKFSPVCGDQLRCSLCLEIVDDACVSIYNMCVRYSQRSS